MFLTAADFNILPYTIANPTALGTGLTTYIDNVEKEVLYDLLGKDLYDAFVAGLAVVPAPDPIWTNLRDGKEYVYKVKNYKWVGMKAMLKPIVYSRWTKDNHQQDTGGVGVVKVKGQNALPSNPSRKIVEAHLKSKRIAGDLCYQQDSLCGFLKANESIYYVDFPFYFCPIKSINSFNL